MASLQSIHSMLIYDDEDGEFDEDVLKDDNDVLSNQKMISNGIATIMEGNEEEFELRRVTRSSFHSNMQDRNKYNRSISTMDVPMLGQLQKLFTLVDSTRMKLKSIQGTNYQSNNDPYNSNLSERTENMRIVMMSESSYAIRNILNQMDMKCWTCLIPRKDYPLPQIEWTGFDSSSLSAKCHFTPAEDDLLLRGMIQNLTNMSINHRTSNQSGYVASNTESRPLIDEEDHNYPWDTIRTLLLPSKDVQSLQFRYSQRTSVSHDSNQNNTKNLTDKFKLYVQLKKKYVEDYERTNTWTLFEDMQLLKGFQVHGSKWHLINLLYLPHRCLKDVKFR